MQASSRSQLNFNNLMIRIILALKCYLGLHSPKNWEFRMICRLARCEDRRPCVAIGLSLCNIITHSVKRQQLVGSVSAILSHAHIKSVFFQFGLAIHQNDHQARRRFVEWAQNEIAVVPDFHKRILFSDEAHFWLNGYVNKQNCRIWSEANPQMYVETPLHLEKLTVWCALWAGGILLQKR
ncbi:DUF4817 domain-containing protein [Trichonephila clavipes]|nr:DUF4817 domain-containing protein [Trichonephila clavipes]